MIDDPREAYAMAVYEEYPTEYDDDVELTTPAYANAPQGPWTLAVRLVEIRTGQNGWRVQAESPNYKYGEVTAMTYPESDYKKAVAHFERLKSEIDLSVPADAERKVLCSYCDKELGEDFRPFLQLLPFKSNDIGYCGCKGWD